MNRRNMLAAIGCAAALGTAEWLRPREQVLLMPSGAKLSGIVPTVVGPWSLGGGQDIVIPRVEGTLAARLYHDQLARQYVSDNPDLPDVMMLIAYGSAQNDLLQLHRPETCYPAIGFEIVGREFVDIPVSGGRTVPAVSLTAKAGARVEDILYWTRLGDALPRTQGEQRSDRFKAALAGYIEDGVLVRISSVRTADSSRLPSLKMFMSALVGALRPEARVALLGRRLFA